MPIAFAFCSATVVKKYDLCYVFVSGKTMDQVRQDGGTEASASNLIQYYCESSKTWNVLRTSEALEAGPLVSIGNELITIGGPNKESTTSIKTATKKAVCRRWNLSNVDLGARSNEQGSVVLVENDNGYNSISYHRRRHDSIDGPSLGSGTAASSILRQRNSHTRNASTESTAQTPITTAVAVEINTVTSQDNYEFDLAPAVVQNGERSLSDLPDITHVHEHAFEHMHGESSYYTGDLCRQTNKPYGRGRMRWDYSGEVYDGVWRNGLQHGLGLTCYTSTNDTHEGFYHEGKKHGAGKYKWCDGREYEGNFVNDFPEDVNGKLVWKDGRKYVGTFIKGERTGRGKMWFPNADVYEGYFLNGKYEGFGVLKFHDGRVYEGYWKNNQADGQGILKGPNGEKLHEGLWKHDRPAAES
jgi:hypothetical protein